jgi:hypothetical protein
VLRLQSDELLQRLQSFVMSAATLEADMQRAQQSHAAELARAHQAQQQTAEAVYNLRRARKQDGVELALLAAELRRADDERVGNGPTASVLQGAADQALGLQAVHPAIDRPHAGEHGPPTDGGGMACLPDVADDSDTTHMSISFGDRNILSIRREEIDGVSLYSSGANAGPHAPPTARAAADGVSAAEAYSREAPAASIASNVLPHGAGHTITPAPSKPAAPTAMMPPVLHPPPTSKPAATLANRIKAAVVPSLSQSSLHRATPGARLAPSPLHGSSEHDTGTNASRSTVGSTSPATGALTGELTPDIMRAVAAFGLGDAIARLQQPLTYGGRMGPLLPSMQPPVARSNCAVSPNSVISSPHPEPWYMQQAHVSARPPREPAARAPPPHVKGGASASHHPNRKRKHGSERDPRLTEAATPDRPPPTPAGSPPRHVAKVRRTAPPPVDATMLQKPFYSEPTHVSGTEQAAAADENIHAGNAQAPVLEAPLSKEALRSHQLACAPAPRKKPAARRVLDLFGDDF